MSGNGGNPHSLRDLLGTYEKSGLGSDVVGIYRHNAGRSRHIIDAPSHPEWKEKCASTVRIEPPTIKSLMKNGKTLQKGMKVHLSKIQVKAISGNRFECKAGKVEVLD